ncbi:nucleoside-diphosphate kinase [Actinomadura decatromicini]|uniref:nucleoside-diphosphate kinase n=1 Tax=Actinomadura decatromicini TaxID=2604572 RepID=A0A5D3F8D9_9ACTN|nr:nucleoside-diphosphate kinase [Actinomadura decatromicini]TYK44591.1 nucleoside-diphosphate kinase [Actinomadura decatromicini]
MERTLVIIKPDGVANGLVGRVVSRLEQAGLRIVQLKLTRATKAQILDHYAEDPEWLENAGARAVERLQANGIDWRELTGCENAPDVGRLIRMRLVDYMCSGPIVVLQAAGPAAVRKTRQIIGATLPSQADPGSLRGGHCSDDVILSFQEKRALENIVHASGEVSEALREIEIWCAGTPSP